MQNLTKLPSIKRAFNKRLFVFDFDETITNANTDTFIYNVYENQKLPDEVLDKYMNKGQWNNFMKEVFTHMHQIGVTHNQLRDVLVDIPMVPGMIDVLHKIKENGDESVIISNANTLFLDWILEHHKLQDLISRIYTNPAHVDETGKINLGVAHTHDCKICWFNQCKTKSLTQFANEKVEKDDGYSNYFYFGDGANDICPIECMGEQDYGFVRKGMALEDRIQEYKDQGVLEEKIKANLVFWNDGHDVLKEFANLKL